MPTERLYFSDPYLTAFDAHVISRGVLDNAPAVVLDRTAFYPEGGGQPADAGTLNHVPVVDVQVRDGEVWHRLDRALDDDTVEGHIDWHRRFDHMQQHHGQHLLSAAFEALHGASTASFHLGATVTIDLATSELSERQIRHAEDLANQIVWENRPVVARFVSAAELAKLPLRKMPTVDGPVRIVSVPDFDHSPCGGTHPRSTGAVGVIHVRGRERRGGQLRIEFACGHRVLGDLRRKHELLTAACGDLTVGLDEFGEAVRRLQTAERSAYKQLETARKQLLDYEVRELLERADTSSGVSIVCAIFTARGLDEIQHLAQQVARAGGLALVATQGEKTQLVFAAGDAVPLHCGELLRGAVQPHGGRGGGRDHMAQGGLPPDVSVEEVLDAARSAAVAAIAKA